MKIALFLLLSTLFLFGKGVEWKTWKEALAVSKENHKIIMIEAVRKGCHYCEDMQKNVFDDKIMADLIQNRFIPVKISLDQEDLPLDVEVFMTPTFYFMTEDKKLIKTIPGSWNQEDFTDMLKEIK